MNPISFFENVLNNHTYALWVWNFLCVALVLAGEWGWKCGKRWKKPALWGGVALCLATYGTFMGYLLTVAGRTA